MATFQPHKPEIKVTMAITAKEAHLLNSLRKYEFGQFTVHKAGGTLVRLEINESILLKEEGLKEFAKSG